MKGSELIAKILKAEGIEYTFCFPSNPVIDAAAKENIKPIICRTERTGINMAEGYSRTSNPKRVAVCMVQAGPGIENAYGGLAQAFSDSSPILLMPGGPSRQRQGLPSQFDAVANYAGITKWADRIHSAERIPEMMRRAFTLLRTGRPGPVLLEVPGDVADAEVKDEAFSTYKPVRAPRSAAAPQDITDAVRTLLASKDPLIHVGQGVLQADATAELVEFAELIEAPLMTTTLGKGSFPESHPLSIGSGGAAVSGGVMHFLPKADLVFSVGSSLSRTLVSCPIPPGKTMIQCTLDERDINAEYPIAHAVLGDAKLVLAQLSEEVRRQAGVEGRKGKTETLEEIASVKKVFIEKWLPKLTSDEMPLNPYRVIWDLMHTVDRTKAIITHDSGSPRDQLSPFYEAIMPNGYIGWGNSTQLGSSVGMAMGASMANPDPERFGIAVLGDAALGMCGMDIETAARNHIPFLTVLLNNSVMGGYERFQPYAVEAFGIKNLTGDYSKVADGLGVHVERVEKPSEIVPAIERALQVIKAGNPAFLEMITMEEPAQSRM
ncbi:MAG: thiamine pyrophosphate-requiring protein [Dehalococcoidia bacterium]|nr:thiamine pyrophosphate-requiring protein [Dehalococcoidia bacterium]